MMVLMKFKGRAKNRRIAQSVWSAHGLHGLPSLPGLPGLPGLRGLTALCGGLRLPEKRKQASALHTLRDMSARDVWSYV
jgi:hypothetical protein